MSVCLSVFFVLCAFSSSCFVIDCQYSVPVQPLPGKTRLQNDLLSVKWLSWDVVGCETGLEPSQAHFKQYSTVRMMRCFR